MTSISVTASEITFKKADGTPATGVSAAVTNNGTSVVTITFTTTATLTEAIEANIPVHLDDVTYNKKFSMAVAKTGSGGATGVGIKSTIPQYYLSSSNTAPSDGSWSNNPPAYINGRYYWTRFYTTYTNNTTATSTPVLDQALTDANKQAYDAKVSAKAAQNTANKSASDLADLTTSVNKDIGNLQNQIDGAIENWFYDGVPTLKNKPAVDWTDDKTKNIHLGDIYYDNNTGYAYRFKVDTSTSGNTYSWARIPDTDASKAIADAKAAKDLADNKRRVFYATPTPPYDQGDLWVQGSGGDIMRCQTPKAAGTSYAAGDWVKASKYTDDSTAKAAAKTVKNQYYLSNSKTELVGGSWSDTAPAWTNGKYMWQRTVTTDGNNKVTYTPSENGVCIAGAKGDTGATGADAVAMTITASNGTIFKNNNGSTVLTAHVYVGGVEKPITDVGVCAGVGTIKWYISTNMSTAVSTSKTLTVTAQSVTNSISYVAQCEA